MSFSSLIWNPSRGSRDSGDVTGYVLPTALPIVQAPMAGGPSTPQLAAAVADAGGLGFIAAGYLTAGTLRQALETTSALTDAPLGVNVFVPSAPSPRGPIEAYARGLAAEAERLGAELGSSSWDDDHYEEKIDVLVEVAPHLVTFTFGYPEHAVVERLHGRGVSVGVTVTSAGEARIAADVGADVLVVQGSEAGGHRGTFDPATPDPTALTDALHAIGGLGLPMIATGGIMSGADAAAAFADGALAVQLGTALLAAPESATSRVHRAALTNPRFTETVVTRAFSGRWARGLRNRFADEHADAPSGYPEIHYLTRPLRAAAIAAGDPDVPNLWAGTGWRAITSEPAADIVQRIAADLAAAR